MTYERSSSSRKSANLLLPAIILSGALVLSSLVIYKALLKAESGRYEITSPQFAAKCMLFDSKTGDCFGVINGQLTRFNIRKSNLVANSDFSAATYAGQAE